MASMGSPGSSLTKAKAQMVMPISVGSTKTILLRRYRSILKRGRRLIARRSARLAVLVARIDAVETLNAGRLHHHAADILAEYCLGWGGGQGHGLSLLLEPPLLLFVGLRAFNRKTTPLTSSPRS